VLIFISHDPDQSNHKGSLLCKKEDNNNQANDYFEQVYKIHFRLPFTQSTAQNDKQKSRPWLGRLSFSLQVWLFFSHRCHPNRNLVLKNKDRNNNDKDEVGEKGLHSLSQVFRSIIGAFENTSRANRCNFMVFTKS